MPNQFFSPEGDLENYFVTEYWLIDQYIGDELWVWGNGLRGFLGNGVTTGSISTPITTFAGGTNWKQISSGSSCAAAIKTDGTLWTWGYGFQGRLGNGVTTGSISTPVTTFAGGTDWKQVSVGRQHAAAIKTDGTLWNWGSGYSGQLGTNDEIFRSTPVTTFTGGTNWKQVSAGLGFTAALKTDGTLWSWGFGGYGNLGRLSGLTFRQTPVTTFAGGTNWADTPDTAAENLYTISAGSVHISALKTDGTLWVWGLGSYGQLGNSTILNRSTPVTTFAGGTNWKQVSAGSGSATHTAAIKIDGTLWLWGDAVSGKLGNTEGGTTFGIFLRSTPITTFAGGTNWKQVSGGSSHTAAIKTDGTLWTWGNGPQIGNTVSFQNVSTPVTTFAGGTNWKQVSSGSQQTAAIKTDGTLWVWGSAFNGQLGNGVTTGNISTPITTFAGGTNWKQASCGSSFIAAIKTDGTLWVWGDGGQGRLGNFATTNRSTPVTTFAGGTNWKQVSIAASPAAIKTDGTLWTWGNGANGRLGDNTTTDKSTPVTTFAGGTNWKQVSSGFSHTIALRDDGVNKELYVFGSNTNGRIGTNDTTDKLTPVTTFAGGTNWADVEITNPEDLYTITGGNQHTAAIKTDGTLWAWGRNFAGSIGNTLITDNTSTPVTTFSGGTNWRQVSSGYQITSAIKTDGTLWTWGYNLFGQLGTNDFSNKSTPITTFAGGTNWKQISIGKFHAAAVKTDGTLWTWGAGANGRLGNNQTSNKVTPITTFAGGTDWKQVSSAYQHMAAIKTDGTLWVWGFAADGQLGTNSTTGQRITPVTTFAGGNNWKQVSAGYYHTAAIKIDGTLWIWGTGMEGQLGNASTDFQYTPITTFAGGTNWKQVDAGYYHTAAIKTDGTLWTWGYGKAGRLGNSIISIDIRISTPVTTFAGGTNWKQVTTGGYHTMALKDNNEFYIFGANGYQQLGINFNTAIPEQVEGNATNWKQVSCGDGSHSAAIKTDGTLWVWGYNSPTALGNNQTSNQPQPTPITTFAGGTNWKQVDAGTDHTAAIKTDGTLWVWGDGGQGRLGTNATTNRSTPVTTFAGGTNWKQVDAGTDHTAAIKTDGTLWAWGSSGNGELGNAPTLLSFRSTPVTTTAGGTNWKQVSAGNRHTAAVQSGISPEYPLS